MAKLLAEAELQASLYQQAITDIDGAVRYVFISLVITAASCFFLPPFRLINSRNQR
jgi:hypothetical protein